MTRNSIPYWGNYQGFWGFHSIDQLLDGFCRWKFRNQCKFYTFQSQPGAVAKKGTILTN